MYQKIYNSMAVIIRKIEDRAQKDKTFLGRFRSYDKQKAQTILWEKIPLLFEQDGSGYKEIGTRELEYWEDADQFISQCDDDFVLAYLLLQMDLAIEKRIRSEGELSNKIRILEALNSNHNETAIIILPQLASFWERGGRGTQHSCLMLMKTVIPQLL